MKFFMFFQIFLYRLTGGKIGAKFGGGQVLLLDSVGRKTGKKHTNPVMYIRDDNNNYVITASAGGGPHNPGWYYNLKANPRTTIQVMDQKMTVTAEEASAEKREVLWALLVAKQPQFKGYESKTTRKIPMVILKP
jgi:deazaflavin-dependent oxidoreductase (nitroreductase family)